MGSQGDEVEGDSCTQEVDTCVKVIDGTDSGMAKVDHNEVELPVSRRQMFCMWLSTFTQGIQITLSYTLAAYMVRRLMGPDASEQVVGQLTGILAAAGFFSRCLVAYAWGIASDRLGRKVVVQIGMLAGILDILAFGGFHRYALVLTSRFVLGLFASVQVGVRSMGGDVKSVTEKTRIAAATSLAWSIGSIMGFVIGGEMSDPCAKYSAYVPMCGPGGLFRERPYFPPCLFAGAINTLGLIFNCMFLEETLLRPKGFTGMWPALWRPRYTRLPESDSPRARPGNPNPPSFIHPAANGTAAQNPPQSTRSRPRHPSPPFLIDPAANGTSGQNPAESACVLDPSLLGNHAATSGPLARYGNPNDSSAVGDPLARYGNPTESSPVGEPTGSEAGEEGHCVAPRAKKMGRFDSASSATSASEIWGRPVEIKPPAPLEGGLATSGSEIWGGPIEIKPPAPVESGLELTALPPYRDSVPKLSVSKQTGGDAVESGMRSGAVPAGTQSDVPVAELGAEASFLHHPGNCNGVLLSSANGISRPTGSAGDFPGDVRMAEPLLPGFDVLPVNGRVSANGVLPPHCPHFDDGAQRALSGSRADAGAAASVPPLRFSPTGKVPTSSEDDAVPAITIAVDGDVPGGARAPPHGPYPTWPEPWRESVATGEGRDAVHDRNVTSHNARQAWATAGGSLEFRDNAGRPWGSAEGGGSGGDAGRAWGTASGNVKISADAGRPWGSAEGGGSRGDAGRAWGAGNKDVGPEKDVCQAWGSAHGTWRVVTAEEVGVADGQKAADDLPWFRQRRVLQVLAGSGMLSLLWCYVDELTPIYVSAGLNKGGLGMALSTFTNANVFSGGVLVLFTLFIYPAYSKRVGPLRACLAGMVAAVPAILLIPAASLFAPNHPLLEELFIYAGITLRALCKMCTFTAFMVIVNIVTPRSQIGAVNGMAVTLASLGRSAGPALSGTMWALSVSLGFQKHAFLGFGVAVLAFIAARIVYGRLRVPDR